MSQPAEGVVDVTEADLRRVRAFLEARIETSLFLLNNLRAFGPRAGESPYSGNFRAIIDGGRVRAAWCATRAGHLVVQAGGDEGLAPAIEADAATAPGGVRGVLGDWSVASAVWRLVRARGLIHPTQESREVLYRLALAAAPVDAADGRSAVRTLTPDDLDAWDRLAVAFLREQRLPEGVAQDRRAGFVKTSRNGHWWGAWDGDDLVSIAGFNAFYRPAAQVGGVFTLHARRRQGFSRRVMRVLLRDAVAAHGLSRVVLFTGERAHPARALYESLGFEAIGAFGLFFGTARAATPEVDAGVR